LKKRRGERRRKREGGVPLFSVSPSTLSRKREGRGKKETLDPSLAGTFLHIYRGHDRDEGGEKGRRGGR